VLQALFCSGRLVIGIFGTGTAAPLFRVLNRMVLFSRQPPTVTGLPIRLARAGNGGGRIRAIASMKIGNALIYAGVFSR
jgi:hypothetical protein